MSASLFNVTSGNQVATASFTSTSTTTAARAYFCTRDFQNTDAQVTDDADFEVKIKVAAGTGTARLHRAGLWINLVGVSKLLTYNRLLRAYSATSATTVDSGRRQLNPSFFTSPTVRYECIGSVTTAGISPRLVTMGANDTGGTAGGIASSGLTFTGSTKQSVSSGSLSITDGDRYLSGFTGTGSLDVGQCQAIIQLN